MSSLFRYKGKRIRNYKIHLKSFYVILLSLPFFAVGGLLEYFAYIKNNLYLAVTIIGVTIVLSPALSWLIYRKFFPYFWKNVTHRQMLARMVKDRGFMNVETKQNSGSSKSKKKITYYPKVYYRYKDGFITVRFPLDLGKHQEQFLKLAPVLESGFFSDLTEQTKEDGYVVYKFLYDTKINRINIKEMVSEVPKIRLMKNSYWDYESTPHALIAGGTGGGKTYFLFTLISQFMQIGTVDIIDGKRADLADLGNLEAFRGNVYYGAGILKAMRKNLDEMQQRYKEIKAKSKGKIGNNYRVYGFKPHFIVFDEWIAFLSSLGYSEQDELMTVVNQIILLGRQAGFFIVMATQRPDATYMKDGMRDAFGLRLTLGKMSTAGYAMMFGSETKKDFFNTNEKGRGYADLGDSNITMFYSPLVTKDIDFVDYFNSIYEKSEKCPERASGSD